VGSLLDLTVLDVRQYRSAQNLRDGTILGATQKQWLLDDISSARETWQVWINSIMLSQLARPGGYYFTDQWDGFRAGDAATVLHAHAGDRGSA
jgi:alkaline phosphatase D